MQSLPTEGNEGTGRSMRAFWDAKARENAMFYIHTEVAYRDPDQQQFWDSGVDNLDRTLAPFGRALAPTDRVLEIGCGIGRITRAIAGRAAHVVGIDVSAEMIEQARAANAGVANAEFRVGNGVDLAGADDASADVVYSFIVFQHIPDPEITCRYIRDIGRVLRPGGWTVFQVSNQPEVHTPGFYPTDRSIGQRIRQLIGRAPRGCLNPEWLGSAVSRAQLDAALADGGLVLDGIDGEGTQYCLVNAHKP